MPDPSILPSIISATSGLIGAIIGGVITYRVQRAQHREDRDEERKALAAGIAAELEAYVDLIEWRDNPGAMREIITLLRAGEDLKLSEIFNSRGGKNPEIFPLMYKQLDKVGLLGELSGDVVRFYTRMWGFGIGMETASLGEWDAIPISRKISLLETEVKFFEDTLRAGRATAQQLKKLAY